MDGRPGTRPSEGKVQPLLSFLDPPPQTSHVSTKPARRITSMLRKKGGELKSPHSMIWGRGTMSVWGVADVLVSTSCGNGRDNDRRKPTNSIACSRCSPPEWQPRWVLTTQIARLELGASFCCFVLVSCPCDVDDDGGGNAIKQACAFLSVFLLYRL